MQTFLPYPDFGRSARALDRLRLGKQRVEVLQILRALAGESRGWRNHPAVRMWEGHERALARYGLAMIHEWVCRGYRDTCREKILDLGARFPEESEEDPEWLGDAVFHASHRSALARKKPEHYPWDPEEVPEYVWPI